MKIVRQLAYLACAAAYGLIVLGGVVRITGSGMGCGDHWPLCNGRILPPLDDIGTTIEYGHRLAAATLSALVVALVVTTLRLRASNGFRGRGGVTRLSLLALGLLLAQVLLGAITVWLELPPWSVVLHLGAAMALFAVLLLILIKAKGIPSVVANPKTRRAAIGAVLLGGIALLLGALTANMGAAGACTGFPLCSGRLWPSDGHLAVIHWVHRLIGYALTLHLIGMAMMPRKAEVSALIKRAIHVSLGLTLLQVVVAAVMVLTVLQPHWRALHVAAGTAVWGAVFVLGVVTRPPTSTRTSVSP